MDDTHTSVTSFSPGRRDIITPDIRQPGLIFMSKNVMYLAIKTFHVITVMISIGLFLLRYGLVCRQSAWADNQILKVIPHVNDSLLLTSGIALIGITGFVPFTPSAPWLSVKLMSVVAYILCGAFALKAKNNWQRWGFFAGAMGWLVFILNLAISKHFVLDTLAWL